MRVYSKTRIAGGKPGFSVKEFHSKQQQDKKIEKKKRVARMRALLEKGKDIWS